MYINGTIHGHPSGPHSDISGPTPPCCRCGKQITDPAGPILFRDKQSQRHTFHPSCFALALGIEMPQEFPKEAGAFTQQLDQALKRSRGLLFDRSAQQGYTLLTLLLLALRQPGIPPEVLAQGRLLGRILQSALMVTTRSGILTIACETLWDIAPWEEDKNAS
jgi:hypothetical protein